MNSEIRVLAGSKTARMFYLALGFLLVGIGVLGIFVPLLPTTIFLILASVCFMKSSPKAYEWLKNNKYLGSYVQNYKDKSGLSLATKISNIIILWISIGFSAFYFTEELYIRLILGAIAVGVTIHLIMIKTKVKSE